MHDEGFLEATLFFPKNAIFSTLGPGTQKSSFMYDSNMFIKSVLYVMTYLHKYMLAIQSPKGRGF